jgi:hypothetical protein
MQINSMKPTTKVVLVGITALLGAMVLLDPYSFSTNTSHFRQPAPVWQIGLALTDLCLLGLFARALCMGRERRAIVFLAASTVLNLLLNIVFVLRDGLGRFLMGYGSYDLLPIYLTTIVFRVMLLLAVGLRHTVDRHER